MVYPVFVPEPCAASCAKKKVERECDHIGADACLLEANSLRAQEASLTAESKGVLKDTTVLDAVPPLAERYNMVHKGTSVIQGGDSIACHAPPQTSSVRGRAFGFS